MLKTLSESEEMVSLKTLLFNVYVKLLQVNFGHFMLSSWTIFTGTQRIVECLASTKGLNQPFVSVSVKYPFVKLPVKKTGVFVSAISAPTFILNGNQSFCCRTIKVFI